MPGSFLYHRNHARHLPANLVQRTCFRAIVIVPVSSFSLVTTKPVSSGSLYLSQLTPPSNRKASTMSTVLIVVLAVYAAVMTYLRATAAATKTQVDDKLLAAGEKVQPIVDFVTPKVK